MIEHDHDLPVKRQAELVSIARSSAYYTPRPVSDVDLRLMRRIDELHLELPFAGSRMLRDLLRGEGLHVGRKHVATLMRRMGITALYRRPRATRSTHTCCARCPSSGPTKSGQRASATSRWPKGSST